MRWAVALCVLRGPYNVREIAERVGKSLRYIRSRLNAENMTVHEAALISYGADCYLTFHVREPQP
jgi:Sec-independent protein translocase protein TatA